jgi:hypothetical protein
MTDLDSGPLDFTPYISAPASSDHHLLYQSYRTVTHLSLPRPRPRFLFYPYGPSRPHGRPRYLTIPVNRHLHLNRRKRTKHSCRHPTLVDTNSFRALPGLCVPRTTERLQSIGETSLVRCLPNTRIPPTLEMRYIDWIRQEDCDEWSHRGQQ